jgi:hypothetical protein
LSSQELELDPCFDNCFQYQSLGQIIDRPLRSGKSTFTVSASGGLLFVPLLIAYFSPPTVVAAVFVWKAPKQTLSFQRRITIVISIKHHSASLLIPGS